MVELKKEVLEIKTEASFTVRNLILIIFSFFCQFRNLFWNYISKKRVEKHEREEMSFWLIKKIYISRICWKLSETEFVKLKKFI